MNASISASSDDRGWWKFVISASTTAKGRSPWMKRSVVPSRSPVAAADSRARTLVVPIATLAGEHRRVRHAVPLGVHLVVLDGVDSDRTERAEAHDQLDRHHEGAGAPRSLEELGGEVETCGGRGDGARPGRVGGLVAL